MHAALSGTATRIDDAWIADLVSVVLDGARPSRQSGPAGAPGPAQDRLRASVPYPSPNRHE